MSGFSEQALERKLADLNNSQQSIQQLSLWLIHHRKHYQTVVKLWMRELGEVSNSRKLTFLYLANDVVQNSKKKYPEYAKEFGTVMKKVLEHLAVIPLEDKTVQSIARLLNIWQDRSIFDPKIQTDLSRIWTTKTLEAAAEASEEIDDKPPPPKKHKPEKTTPPPKPKQKVRVISVSSETSEKEQTIETILSPHHSPSECDPPEPEELIKALQDLEYSASSDAQVREKIARLPPEVSEVSHLASLKSSEEGQQLLAKVDEAMQLLNEYNERLQQELKDRKRVSKMIVDFMAAQRDLETQAEERLEQYRDKLDKVNAVRDDLKSHIQSLPDLTKLPDVTGGLAPLPSAGDLFMVK